MSDEFTRLTNSHVKFTIPLLMLEIYWKDCSIPRFWRKCRVVQQSQAAMPDSWARDPGVRQELTLSPRPTVIPSCGSWLVPDYSKHTPTSVRVPYALTGWRTVIQFAVFGCPKLFTMLSRYKMFPNKYSLSKKKSFFKVLKNNILNKLKERV